MAIDRFWPTYGNTLRFTGRNERGDNSEARKKAPAKIGYDETRIEELRGAAET